MKEVLVSISDEAYGKLEEFTSKHGVELDRFLSRIVNDFILYDLDEVADYINRHDYGELPVLEKLVTGFLDMLELGIITHSNLEQYILDALETNKYWLEDYGIDLDGYTMWFLFTGSGLVEEFIIDVDTSSVSIVCIHSIEDLVSEKPSIVEEIGRVLDEISIVEGVSVVLEEDEIKLIARASSLSELPKMRVFEEIVKSIFDKLGVERE